jgi:hypothetical protein
MSDVDGVDGSAAPVEESHELARHALFTTRPRLGLTLGVVEVPVPHSIVHTDTPVVVAVVLPFTIANKRPAVRNWHSWYALTRNALQA